MSIKFSFEVQRGGKKGKERAGKICTRHGDILTPAFIPVGTKATVKAVTTGEMKMDVKAQAILANTYHLYLQPGTEVLEKAGGLNKFMNWSGPTFTDSGGFQAFSLGAEKGRKSKIANKEKGEGRREEEGGRTEKEEMRENVIDFARVDDDGVTFKSVIDGSTHRFTPEISIDIQKSIGADIIFAFDECLNPHDLFEKQERAVLRTTEWAKRCIAEFTKKGGGRDSGQALLGIVQGGRHEDLRRKSAKEIAMMDFDGFGIGGSFDKDDIGTAVGWVTNELPENKPRHLLGIGDPKDLVMGVENGVDTFDCVSPTRIARNGSAYVHIDPESGEPLTRVNLTNARYAKEFGPIDPSCSCSTCKDYSCAYIAHLFKAKEMLAATLVSIHNLYFLVSLVERLRLGILEGKFEQAKEGVLTGDF